ncbi:MAG: penicillin-binding transpeptidase domain-containing protein, partial [Chloroflexota bacterium]
SGNREDAVGERKRLFPITPNNVIRDLAVFFLSAFAILALATGYWNFVSREALVSRGDNPRALILYNRTQSERGRILDRDGAVLAETTGAPDDYTRRYELREAAAHVTGYASFSYGLSGIEAAADSTLSGDEGLTDFERWWRHDLLGEIQTGRDVQLTLDLKLQQSAFDALAGRPGAIVIVHPASGDLLALASSPSFDPARLDADFETISANVNGPLINRATTALYPASQLLALFPPTLDLSSAPDLPIPTSPADGEKVSPLQMALLAAAIVNNGEMPAPRLMTSVQTATGHPIAVIPPDAADALRARFESNAVSLSLTLPGYAVTLPSGFGEGTVGWFIGFAPDGSYAICVLLEDGTGEEAAETAVLALK